MITITKVYIKNGKILMDGKNSEGTAIHQVVSAPFVVDEEKQIFTLTGSMEFLQDLAEILTKSLKK